MSLEIITAQSRTAADRATGTATYTDGIRTGARQLDAETVEESLGEVDFSSETSAVRIDRTPGTQAAFIAGSFVKWREELWKIEGRTEALRRTAYDLELSKAT